MERYRIPIEGMTCTSCVARITKAVRRVDGVASVRVDLASDSAVVGLDPARASLARVGAAIQQAGYVARVEEAELVADISLPEPGRSFPSRFLPSR